MQTLVSDRGLRRADPPSQEVLTGEFMFMQNHIHPIQELVEDSAPRIRECDGIAVIQPFVAHAFSSFEKLLNTIDWSPLPVSPDDACSWFALTLEDMLQFHSHSSDGIRHLVTPSLVAALERVFIQFAGTEDWRHMYPRSLWVDMCKDCLLDLTSKVPPCRAPPPDASSSAAGPQSEKQNDQAAEPEPVSVLHFPADFPVEVDATATPHEMSTAPDAATGTRLLVSILRTVEHASTESEWDKLWENDAFQKISDAGTLHLAAFAVAYRMQTLVSDRGLRRADPSSQDVLTGEFESMYKNIDSIWELVEDSAPRIRECDGIAAIQPFVAHAFSSFETLLNTKADSSLPVSPDDACSHFCCILDTILEFNSIPQTASAVWSHRRSLQRSSTRSHSSLERTTGVEWRLMVSRLCAGAKISSSISGRRSRRALRPMRCLPLEILNQGNTATKLRNATLRISSRQWTRLPGPQNIHGADAETRTQILISLQRTAEPANTDSEWANWRTNAFQKSVTPERCDSSAHRDRSCLRGSARMQTHVSDRGSDAQTAFSIRPHRRVHVHAEHIGPIRELVEDSAPRIRECDGIAAIQPFVTHAFSSFEKFLSTIDWSLPVSPDDACYWFDDILRHTLSGHTSLVAALERAFIQLVGTENWRQMEPEDVDVRWCKRHLLDLTSKVPLCAPPGTPGTPTGDPQSEKHTEFVSTLATFVIPDADPASQPCGFLATVDAVATPHETSMAPDTAPATSPAASMDIPRTP
ncbi:uncharacterized protein BXZ73DRAFT_82534 [Epithele typhae]|uniref:uncharacterized protein n=1 Tax=Epithele typhae TaxID=378194 RepID=UPI002007F32F|nr:uncharacterized protein BXZ73DRAFT_82534 [Epithele typhae]KAH9912066.1 hypothetical protein BXZ73DRAFT_82534 [Epithele typhae]